MAPTKKQQLKARNQAAFLAAYVQVGTLLGACRKTDLSRTVHYQWLADPDYEARFVTAHEEAVETAEMEMRRRAIEGVEKPVYYRGEVVGHITEYSDALLMFMLKAEAPDKYREKIQLLTPEVMAEQLEILRAELQRRETERARALARLPTEAIEAQSSDLSD
jgi:hypothetical protein